MKILQNDPRTKQVLDLVNQNGGNAESVFYSMAKQMNVDPNTILNQINSMKF